MIGLSFSHTLFWSVLLCSLSFAPTNPQQRRNPKTEKDGESSKRNVFVAWPMETLYDIEHQKISLAKVNGLEMTFCAMRARLT